MARLAAEWDARLAAVKALAEDASPKRSPPAAMTSTTTPGIASSHRPSPSAISDVDRGERQRSRRRGGDASRRRTLASDWTSRIGLREAANGGHRGRRSVSRGGTSRVSIARVPTRRPHARRLRGGYTPSHASARRPATTALLAPAAQADTRPVNSRPLSDAQAAKRVKHSSWEPRPANRTANRHVLTQAAAHDVPRQERHAVQGARHRPLPRHDRRDHPVGGGQARHRRRRACARSR